LAADYYLQLENFPSSQILENRLESSLGGTPAEAGGKLAGFARPFLDAVAQPSATPGGGSVAALAGALGACLGQMVAGLSRKKKSQAAHVDALSTSLEELRGAAQLLTQAIDQDSASYDAVLAAFKLPQETEQEKVQQEEAVQRATRGAAEVPLFVAGQALHVYEALKQLEAISSAAMMSDLRVGRFMAAAAVRGALENVAINLDSITDASYIKEARAKMKELEARLA